MVATVMEQNETLREMNVALYSLVTQLVSDLKASGAIKAPVPFVIRSPIVELPTRNELPSIDTRPDRPRRRVKETVP